MYYMGYHSGRRSGGSGSKTGFWGKRLGEMGASGAAILIDA